jgi:hypothetical protein
MKKPNPKLQQFVYMGMHGVRTYVSDTGTLTPKQIEKAFEEGRRLRKAGAACDKGCPYCHGVSA